MKFSIGVDEAGRGAWAGPIVAAAVFSSKPLPPSIRDSKELSKKQRELSYQYIIENFHYGLGVISSQAIDSQGLSWANKRAMELAIKDLRSKMKIPPSTKVLVDGKNIGLQIPGVLPPQYIIDGDRIKKVISAASIVAKVTRDAIMSNFKKLDSIYKFSKHKGYGTGLHLEQLKAHGVCDIHRKSFSPIKKLLEDAEVNMA
jgi:ribonuclease HII